jgi:hypothetical protein
MPRDIKNQKIVRSVIAQRLKAARENAGYVSLADFCAQHHFVLERYARHEEGKEAMIFSEILQYCAVLPISLCFLMLGEEAEALGVQFTEGNHAHTLHKFP